MNYSINELEHHGILGMHWGVRRYQNKDGSLTPAGQARYNTGELSDETRQNIKKAAAIGAAAIGTAAIGYAIYKNPQKAKEYLGKAKNVSGKALNNIKNESISTVKKSVKASEKAATDAAIMTISATAITKIDQMFPENTDDERANTIAKIAKTSAKESVRTATMEARRATGSNRYGSSYSSGSNKGSQTSNSIGSPSGKPVDKSSEAYRQLFNGVSPETKATLKSMASKGYDIDQLEKYKSLNHSNISLTHYGLAGMHWGERRWQYADGRFNEAGKERYFGKGHRTSNSSEAPKQHESNSIAGGSLKKKPKVDTSGIGNTNVKMNELSPTKKETLRQAMDAVNPPNSVYKKERLMNCGNCVMAYEMRMRGEDVMAKNNTQGLAINSLKNMVADPKSNSFLEPEMKVPDLKMSDLYSKKKMDERSKAVQKSIADSIRNSYDDDGRGCCFVPTLYGSHWISWEKNGNDVTFLNPQNPNYDLDRSFFGNYIKTSHPLAQTTVIRLDNVKIDSRVNEIITSAKNPDLTATYDTYQDVPEEYRPKR